MSFSIKVLPNEPIIVATFHDGFSIAEHMSQAEAETRAILDQTHKSYYDIIDISGWNITFEQVLQLTNAGALGIDSILRHPQIRRIIIITNNQMVMTAAAGLRSELFGNLDILTFDTMDTALTWCRNQIGVLQD